MNIDTLYLAHTFAGILQTTLQGNDIFTVIARNESETDPRICHSHDFCDANQCMIDALEIVGYPYDGNDDAQSALIDEAWKIAADNCFWVGC